MLWRQAVFLNTMKLFFRLALLSTGFVTVRCASDTSESADTTPAPQTPAINYTVAGTLPHDTTHFTEGLEFYNGSLLESTGLEGKSKLVKYDPQTGNVQKEVKLEDKYFGEGVTVLRDTAYQLTYREGVVHVYDAKTLQKLKELPYTNGEGWGLTNDGTYLIGTNNGNGLFYYEPGTFKLVKRVDVTENDAPAVNINELEYVNGYIYANQWQYPYILKIDPATGNVVGKLDLSGLIQQEKVTNPNAEFLNGIAYNPEANKFYVTGKNWSKIYEVKFDF